MMTFRKGTLRPVAQLFPSWMGTAPLLEICRLWRDASPAKTKRNTSDRSGGTQNRKQQNFQAAFRLPVNTRWSHDAVLSGCGLCRAPFALLCVSRLYPSGTVNYGYDT